MTTRQPEDRPRPAEEGSRRNLQKPPDANTVRVETGAGAPGAGARMRLEPPALGPAARDAVGDVEDLTGARFARNDAKEATDPTLPGGGAAVGRRLEAEAIFAEEPVPLDVFLTDAGFLGGPPLSPVQFEAVRHTEQIYLPGTYELMVEQFGLDWTPVRYVNFASLCWGKGSGKDFVCRTLSARVAYLLGCLRSPQRYFRMAPDDTIHILNVARSEEQARQAFFDPLTRMIRRLECFKDRAEFRRGSIEFDNGVRLISGHSSAETQEGLNLLLGIIDEISAFRTRDEVEHLATGSGREPGGTAEAIYEMMRTSGRTRFPQTFKVVAISYPRRRGDAILRLVAKGREGNEAKGAASRHFVSGPLATWEVNPNRTKDDFVEDYEDDPQLARAKYECDPDARMNRLFGDEESVHAAFSAEIPDPLAISYALERGRTEARSGRRLPDRWVARFSLSERLRPIPGARYAIHCDLATRRNRAGVAMAHVSRRVRAAGDGAEADSGSLQEVVIDFVVSFEPDLTADPEREIQIAWVRELVGELQDRGFDIARVSFDGYQSADAMQILGSWGIEVAKLSTDRSPKAWETLRDVISDGRLHAHRRPSIVGELLGLHWVAGKVMEASGGSKDEADAVAGAVYGAIEVGGEEFGGDGGPGDPDAFRTGPSPIGAWLIERGITDIDQLGPGRQDW